MIRDMIEAVKDAMVFGVCFALSLASFAGTIAILIAVIQFLMLN